jgi:protein-tyrosine-phosphatase
MMQALLQRELGDEFQVESAGIRKEAAGQPANEHSITCMQERGIDLSDHVSRWVGDFDLSQYSHIVCVGENEAKQVVELLAGHTDTTVLIANEDGGGVPNPYEKGLSAYRECIVLLDEALPKVADLIR